MRKSIFYYGMAAMVILNSFLLANPNLLGKIGILIYNHFYFRNFPRTLLTVSLVIAIAGGLSELTQYVVKAGILRRNIAIILLSIFTLLGFVLLVRTGFVFSKWAYGHTGMRFQLGAFLLPILIICNFVYGLIMLPAQAEPFPLSPANEENIPKQNPEE